MATPLNSYQYDGCRRWIKDRMSEGCTVEQIRLGCQQDKQGLMTFLRSMIQYNYWPDELDDKIWCRLVDALEEERKRQISIETMSVAALVSDNSEQNTVRVSTEERSAWQTYRTHLLEDSGFSLAAVNNIESACSQTMRVLSSQTEPDNPRRGLIVGNVQSGKTANMAGLMAMAADSGFNMFIVLSGTIENLRVQTQERLVSDLYNRRRRSSFVWHHIDHPAKGIAAGNRIEDFDFGMQSAARYLTVCLKHVKRLDNLIDWLWADPNQLRNMKILVIDDEADQASIDTSGRESDNRTAINKRIIDLVYGPHYCGKRGAYGAMNYISYTATPYANCLNEAGPYTLYPADFIQTLATPLSYFGPTKLFPTPYSEVNGTLDMYRKISKEDLKIIDAIHKGEADDIPGSLQQSLLWFMCVCGIMRYYNYDHPVSMLIHTSQKVDHHTLIADAVSRWISRSHSHLIDWCRDLYAIERLRLTYESFRSVYPEYEHPNETIWSYPDFESIEPYIVELVRDVSRIYMDSDGELQYGRSLLLSIDNCKHNGIDEDGAHMRLAYPDAQQQKQLGFAPAFVVIGGNTLSRGLTLQGLVCSYFLRTVTQADTLMQMARWFGYRPHYELFPRIWMRPETYDKFSLLTSIDYDLRCQIRDMQQLGQTPMDYAPKIITSPTVTWLRLTSPAKMKSAEITDVDFTGTVTQLTVYDKAVDVLNGNLQCVDRFLRSLGQSQPSQLTAAYYWADVPYAKINEGLFGSGFRIAETSRVFQQLEFLNEWVMNQTRMGSMSKWTVIACGLHYVPDQTDEDRIWSLPDGNTLATVVRTARNETDSTINIGVLATRRDFLADIDPSQVTEAQWQEMKDVPAGQLDYASYRHEAGKQSTPLLLIYRIYRESQARPSSTRIGLHLGADAIGLTMVCPGVRSRTESQQRVAISPQFLNIDWSADDAD